MIWMPLFLLPLQLVQSFGTRDRMALNSFSFFSELHRERNRRLGLGDSVINFNFGNLYFIASSDCFQLRQARPRQGFLPRLGGACRLAGVFPSENQARRLLPAGPMAVRFLASEVKSALRKAYQWVDDLSGEGRYPGTDPTANRTAIGSLGKLKQSPDMLWRVRPVEGQIPRLLRLASYNRYQGISWKNLLPEDFRDEELMFRELASIEVIEGDSHYLVRENMGVERCLKQATFFQHTWCGLAGDPLPLPGQCRDTSTHRTGRHRNQSRLAPFSIFPAKVNHLRRNTMGTAQRF